METVFGVILAVGMIAVVVWEELKDKKHVAELKKAKEEAAAALEAAKRDFENKLKAYLGSK